MDTRESSHGPNHRELQDEAVAWLARRDSGEWSPEEQSQLEEWLASSVAHRVAFLRLEAGWDEARRLKALGAGRPQGVVPPTGAWRQSPFFESPRGTVSSTAAREPSGRRRRRLWFTAAASVVLVLGLTQYVRLCESGDRYSTPIGGISSVPLQDGSKITLNTQSQVHVDLSAGERRVDLDRGEAFFEVAKDPKRPFVVRAGDKRIVAVGTQFSVRRNGDDVRVVVTEGTVRLESNGGALHLRESGDAPNLVPTTPAAIPLTAGSVARARDRDLLLQSEPLRQAEAMLSWRQGYLTFHDTPLGDAIAEFNRYNVHQIQIGDPTVASIEISGTFRPTNYNAFVRLLRDGYSLRITTTEDITVLTKP